MKIKRISFWVIFINICPVFKLLLRGWNFKFHFVAKKYSPVCTVVKTENYFLRNDSLIFF